MRLFKGFFVSIFLLVFTFAFSFNVFAQQQPPNSNTETPAVIQIVPQKNMPKKSVAKKSVVDFLGEKYYFILNFIDNGYYRPLTDEEIKKIEKVQDESIKKIINVLNQGVDKHSGYSTAEEKKAKDEMIAGYAGVGIRVGVLDFNSLKKDFQFLEDTIKKSLGQLLTMDDLKENPDLYDIIINLLCKKDKEFEKIWKRIKDKNPELSEKGVFIEGIIPNSPAEKTGLEKYKGWFIEKANNEDAEGLKLQEFINKIRGPEGTKVRLTLRAPEKDEVGVQTVVVELTRQRVKPILIKSEMINDTVGLIDLNIFEFYDEKGMPTAEPIIRQIEKLKKAGMKSLILDLRNNPGGKLMIADEIMDALLPPGLITMHETYRAGGDENASRIFCTSKKVPQIFKGSMVVIINEYSASASELVSIAFKEHGRATIIGQKSYGKATIQYSPPLIDGSVIKLTTGKYLSPVEEEWIHGKGVSPDIIVVDDPKTEEDEAILKAIEILQGSPELEITDLGL